MRGKILKGIAGFYYIETVEEKIEYAAAERRRKERLNMA